MKKITKLTKAQVQRIPEWIDKWIAIGLSTEPADFEKATEAAFRAYRLCNLDKPRVVLRMASPYAATANTHRKAGGKLPIEFMLKCHGWL